MLIVLVLELTALSGPAHLTVMLTAAVRQPLVERVIQNQTARPDGAGVTEAER